MMRLARWGLLVLGVVITWPWPDPAAYAGGRMTHDHARELLTHLYETCGYEVKKITLRRRLIGWSTEAVLSYPRRPYACVGGYTSTDYQTGPWWAPTLRLLVGKMANICGWSATTESCGSGS